MSALDATGLLLEALREGRWRSIGLGRANDRWFIFWAGYGLDAAVVGRVETARSRGVQLLALPDADRYEFLTPTAAVEVLGVP